jgi:myo-inositol 2-dehydrogenase/D-chiro-inositol 1-dehydrogenase
LWSICGLSAAQEENRSPESTVLATTDGFRRPPIERSFSTRYAEAYRRELEAFRACLADGAPVPVTRRDVRAVFSLCEAAARSHREGRPVAVD